MGWPWDEEEEKDGFARQPGESLMDCNERAVKETPVRNFGDQVTLRERQEACEEPPPVDEGAALLGGSSEEEEEEEEASGWEDPSGSDGI